METTAEERTALFERAVAEVSDPVTHVWHDTAAEARMTELIEAQYGLSRRDAQLTAHDWYGNEIARRDPMVRALASGQEAELFDFTERLLAFWKEHPELENANILEAQEAYLKAEEVMFYAIRDAFLKDGDMKMLWHDTGLSADFIGGLQNGNPLHWCVVTRALVTHGIPGVTATTLAQPKSLARQVVLDVVNAANDAAHEHIEEGEDEALEVVRYLARKHAADPAVVMVYPAAEQREKLAEYAAREAYIQDVVLDGIVKRLEQSSPDGTYDEEDAELELERWLRAQPEELQRKQLAEQLSAEWERAGRLAHLLILEPDGYVAEWGAFGIGNREAEAEGTVYEVLKG